jgi:hypothetical protein
MTEISNNSRAPATTSTSTGGGGNEMLLVRTLMQQIDKKLDRILLKVEELERKKQGK